MRDRAFIEFLTTAYRGSRRSRPMPPKVAADTLSRCKRAEQFLGIDLDGQILNIDDAQLKARIHAAAKKRGTPLSTSYSMTFAARRYREFLTQRVSSRRG